MKAKEWLHANGHIDKVGRGRISLENHARLKAAHDEGVRFSDWPKGEVTVSSTPATSEAPAKVQARVARSVSSSTEKVVVDPLITYPADKFRAVVKGTNKPVGMAEVCNNCRVSLVGHACKNPTILGNVAVEVRAIG